MNLHCFKLTPRLVNVHRRFCSFTWPSFGWISCKACIWFHDLYNINYVEVIFLIVKNAYQTKCTPQSKQTLPPPPHSLYLPIYMHLFKFIFRWDLFYTKLQNSHKNYPPHLNPPLTPATKHLGPKSKFCSQCFVCLIKSFAKWYD